jgi:hypothetical protein
MRFFVDYRELNRVAKFDAYPMPRIEDVTDQLGQAIKVPIHGRPNERLLAGSGK